MYVDGWEDRDDCCSSAMFSRDSARLRCLVSLVWKTGFVAEMNPETFHDLKRILRGQGLGMGFIFINFHNIN